MILDAGLEFSDAQALGAVNDGNSVVSGNVVDMRTGLKNAWGDSKAPEIGGSVWNCRVNADMAGAGAAITAHLVTKADASIGSGATPIASVTFPAVSPAGTKRAVSLPTGQTTLRYLGVLYTVGGGNLTAGSFDSFLSLDNEAQG